MAYGVGALIGLVVMSIFLLGGASAIAENNSTRGAGADDPQRKIPDNLVIKKQLSTMKGEAYHTIPKGSTVIHFLDENVTRAVGPNGKILFEVPDNKVLHAATPGGFAPVTHAFAWPSGSKIDKVTENLTKIYGPDGDLLLVRKVVGCRPNEQRGSKAQPPGTGG